MQEIDRVFLKHHVSSMCKGHITAAIALYDAGAPSRIDEISAKTIKHTYNLLDKDAIKQAREGNENARTHNTLTAKLFAECIGAMEDLGALCWAIKERSHDNILKRYINSGPADVDKMFQEFLNDNESIDLSDLLNIPPLETILSKPLPQYEDIIKNYFSQGRSAIAHVAKQYLNRGGKIDQSGKVDSGQTIDMNEVFYTVMAMRPKNSAGSETAKGVLPLAFNKIKHRFLVFESIEEIQNVQQDYHLDLLIHQRYPEEILNLYERTLQVSRLAAEVSALLLTLDEFGRI